MISNPDAPQRMKTNRGFLIAAAVVGCLLGVGVERLLESQRYMGRCSIAGQTLTDLSRALEREKDKSGAYPESITGLEVTSNSGEFSPAVLRRVIYRKTTNGYVAFVGSTHVVYIEPGKGTRFE